MAGLSGRKKPIFTGRPNRYGLGQKPVGSLIRWTNRLSGDLHHAKDLVNDFIFEEGTAVTSDGQTYHNSAATYGVEHIWNYSNSRVSEVYPNTKVVWTMYFPNTSAVYPASIEYGETYFCFDGVTADWYPCLWTDIAYFDLLNQASVYLDDDSVALYLGFFNECRKLQAVPKEFTMKLNAYRLRGIFPGHQYLVSVQYPIWKMRCMDRRCLMDFLISKNSSC